MTRGASRAPPRCSSGRSRRRREVTVRATLDPPQVRVGEAADLAVEIDGAQSAPPPELAEPRAA